VHSNGGFYLQSKAFNDDYWLRDEDNVAIPAQPLNDLQTGLIFFLFGDKFFNLCSKIKDKSSDIISSCTLLKIHSFSLTVHLRRN